MCVAVPGRILSINNSIGKVDFLGVHKDVSLELLKGVNIGDYIIVHAGYAIEKLDEENAVMTIELMKEISSLEKNR